MAQLVARLHGMQKVRGSNPRSSTTLVRSFHAGPDRDGRTPAPPPRTGRGVKDGLDPSDAGGVTAVRRYDDAVAAALPEVAGLLAALFVGLTVLDPLVLDGDTAVVMTSAAAVTALFFAVGYVWVSRSGVPRGWGHPLTATVCLVVAANVLLHLGLTGELWQTSNLLLVVVGLGSGLLDLRWFAAVLAACWLGWAAVVTVFAADQPLLLHWIAGMAAASLLALVVNSARRRSLDALDHARASAEDAAVHDVLTGLLNRRGLELLGRPIVASARRAGNAVSAVFVDVDGLKAVNDAGGHSAGDAVIAAVADGLRHVVRAGDLVARWGGDEFVVVGQGPGMPPLDLERRLKDWIAAEPPQPEEIWSPSVSAGAAMLAPWDDGDLDTLLAAADREMYRRRALRRDVGATPPTPSRQDT